MTRAQQIIEYANSFIGKDVESNELKEIIRLAIIDGAKWADANPVEPSLPSNLDEAVEQIASDIVPTYPDIDWDDCFERIKEGVKAGAEWMAGQGWIDDGSMPPEHLEIYDSLQGHKEFMVSKDVLVWDSMYDSHIDHTINGKWASETRGGYTGQLCHGIIAWRPIPEYKEKKQ